MKIGFVGDIMFGRNLIKSRTTNNFISPDLLKLIKSCDVLCGNLEGPIMRNADKQAVASIPELAFPTLNYFSLVSIANNHIMDYGDNGIKETIKNLSTRNIFYTGIARKWNNPYEPVILKFDNTNVAFLSCVSKDLQKNISSNYELAYLENQQLKEAILNLRKKGVELIIVLAHCGIDYIGIPTRKIKSIAEELIDFGAKIVITNHPHVIGGCELYKDGLIWFSLGDFIFDSNLSMRKKSLLLTVEIENGKIEKVSFYPTVISGSFTVNLASVKVEREIKKTISKNSEIISKSSYKKVFPFKATKSFLSFQILRIYEQYRRKGFLKTVMQLFRRIIYLPKYIAKIFRS